MQAHRETEAHFNVNGMPLQRNISDNLFQFKRAAFFPSLKGKVGLAAAKAAALRINLNIDGCGVAPQCTLPLALPSSQSPFPPRSLVRDGQTPPHKPRFVVSQSTCPHYPPPPYASSFVIKRTQVVLWACARTM